MELQQLRYFLRVAQLGHFTQAAQELIVAESSVSRAISHLEKELGVPLFDKRGRKVVLNIYGQAFLLRVENIFKQLKDGIVELENMSRPDHGQVSLGIPPSVVGKLLPEILIDFGKKYPGISFNFHQDSATVLLNQLQQGNINLCLSMVDKGRSHLNWVELMTEELYLCVSHIHPLARHKSIALEEVAQDFFICLKRGHGLRDLSDNLCREAAFEPKVIFEGEEFGTVRSLVAAGLGVGFFPQSLLENVKEPVVVPLRVKNPVCRRTIGLAWLEKQYMPNAERLFRDAVIDHYHKLG